MSKTKAAHLMAEVSPDVWEKTKEGEEIELEASGLTGEDLALLGIAAGTTTMVVLVGGAIVGTAVILATLTVGSAAVIWVKIPPRIEQLSLLRAVIKKIPDAILSPARKRAMLRWNWKQFVDNHEIAVDIGFSVAVTLMFGLSVTGLVAGSIAGFGVSILLRIRRIYKNLNPHIRTKAKLAKAMASA
jgi:hypothetical protein